MDLGEIKFHVLSLKENIQVSDKMLFEEGFKTVGINTDLMGIEK